MALGREALWLVALAASAAIAAGGCAHQTDEPGTAASATAAGATPGILPPPDAVPGTFTVRQKIVAHSTHGSGGFEAVLQKEPGKLTLLGFTPYGARAFLLEQSAAGVKMTSYIPRQLPFSPDFILMDIHRVLDAWLGPPPAADGERSGIVRDEIVRERWAAGHLARRTFAGANDPTRIVTTIDYQGSTPAGLPAKVTIANVRFGYDLTIETIAM